VCDRAVSEERDGCVKELSQKREKGRVDRRERERQTEEREKVPFSLFCRLCLNVDCLSLSSVDSASMSIAFLSQCRLHFSLFCRRMSIAFLSQCRLHFSLFCRRMSIAFLSLLSTLPFSLSSETAREKGRVDRRERKAIDIRMSTEERERQSTFECRHSNRHSSTKERERQSRH